MTHASQAENNAFILKKLDLERTRAHGSDYCLHARRDAKFPFGPFNRVMHGFLADRQNLANLPIGFTGRDPVQAFAFPLGQRLLAQRLPRACNQSFDFRMCVDGGKLQFGAIPER